MAYLQLSWSISRGRDTQGWDICRLDDKSTGHRFRCMGGGYDMVGTVFGKWLESTYQTQLVAIAQRAHSVWDVDRGELKSDVGDLYGMTANVDGVVTVSLDGACGLDAMVRIAEAIGLQVNQKRSSKQRNRRLTGFWVG